MSAGPSRDRLFREFLSTPKEVHAFGIGVYDGMRTIRARPGKLPENADVQAEPHYFKGGYVLGTLLQLAVLVVLGTVGAGVV